jgi:hypothetical protein
VYIKVIYNTYPSQKKIQHEMEKKNIVVVIGPNDMTAREFSASVTDSVCDEISDPECEILLSDETGCAMLCAKFLSEKGFRACRIFHVGDAPQHTIGKYDTQGGYFSIDHVHIAMRERATKVLKF